MSKATDKGYREAMKEFVLPLCTYQVVNIADSGRVLSDAVNELYIENRLPSKIN